MVTMPPKGYKSVGIGSETYKRLNAEKKERESFTDCLNRIIDEWDPKKDLITLYDLHKAIEAIRNDLSTIVEDAVNDAIAKLRY